MIADFKECKQNYNDLKIMIEETKKRGNMEFGNKIVSAANVVRDKRDKKNGKKDFIGQHRSTVNQFVEIMEIKDAEKRIK